MGSPQPISRVDKVHDCELCRAVLELAESAVRNRAAAAEGRATIRVVDVTKPRRTMSDQPPPEIPWRGGWRAERVEDSQFLHVEGVVASDFPVPQGDTLFTLDGHLGHTAWRVRMTIVDNDPDPRDAQRDLAIVAEPSGPSVAPDLFDQSKRIVEARGLAHESLAVSWEHSGSELRVDAIVVASQGRHALRARATDPDDVLSDLELQLAAIT